MEFPYSPNNISHLRPCSTMMDEFTITFLQSYEHRASPTPPVFVQDKSMSAPGFSYPHPRVPSSAFPLTPSHHPSLLGPSFPVSLWVVPFCFLIRRVGNGTPSWGFFCPMPPYLEKVPPLQFPLSNSRLPPGVTKEPGPPIFWDLTTARDPPWVPQRAHCRGLGSVPRSQGSTQGMCVWNIPVIPV